MPEKGVPAPFGALPGHFLRGPENPKILPIFLGGPLLLSTQGGAIGKATTSKHCPSIILQAHPKQIRNNLAAP